MRVTAEGMRISVDLPMVRSIAGPTDVSSVLASAAAGATALVVVPFVTPFMTAGACAWTVTAPSVAARATQREADNGFRILFFMILP